MSKGRRQFGDCPLTFPEFSLVDHAAHCKTYDTLIKTKTEASTLNVDQLQSLKDDFDMLLASVTERIATLTQETESLTEWLDSRKCEKSMLEDESHDGKSHRLTPIPEKPLARNLRDTATRSEANSPAPSRSKHKQEKQAKPPGLEALGRQPKSDAPEKFWAIVEPYCADITHDDMKSLEELLKSHDDDVDYYKIPSRAKFHEKRKLLSAGQKRRLDSAGETSCSSVDDATSSKASTGGNNSPSDRSDIDECPFGPLTQRLVSALISENAINSVDEDSMHTSIANVTAESVGEDKNGEQPCASALVKQFNVSNVAQLDKRIQEELEQLGILTPSEGLDSDDEILAELKEKQQELRAVGQHNLSMTKRLYRLAKEEMNAQDLRRKLAAVDADVMEAYRRVQTGRQKKRPVPKREKDLVMKALKEREFLVKQIEAISCAGQ
ncbi:TADA3 [Bugula neritina]|uniref:TADA3 n=1 Tax=Bugula neritina TaxID=10212 RepID=A0A7J7JID3_BUGNE|nr:TADA3 [Bugula neritina]